MSTRPLIFHNPKCGTSRNTLALIEASGETPNVIEYLKTPPTRAYLIELIEKMGITPDELLRKKEAPYKALGLDAEGVSDEAIIDAMLAHPILINRPIVVTEKGARLCRPSETVLEILNHPVTRFVKEDGETIYHGEPNPSVSLADLPNIDADKLQPIDIDALVAKDAPRHAPKILILYGSLRARSFSRLAAEEAARLLRWYGCEVRVFNPEGLPLPDSSDAEHPKVAQLRALAEWSEGMMWVSPERHGSMTGIMKAQIDWIPLALGSVRPTQGKTLAIMQVNGGSQSFNTVNQLRILGRWMRMVTIPNQSSVAKAFLEFDDNDRMLDSSYYRRLVDVCEELTKFTWLMRGRAPYLTDRYSERVEDTAALSKRVNQKSD